MASRHELRARHEGVKHKQNRKEIFKRNMAVAALVGVTAAAAIGVFAKEYFLDYGDITVEAKESGNFVSYTDRDGNTYENEKNEDGEIVITQDSEEAVKNTLTIDVEEGQTAEVTIRDVNIDTSNKTDEEGNKLKEAAISIEGAGDAILELDGDNQVISGKNHAGVETAGTGMLTIHDKDEDGSLDAKGGKDGAGIGGGNKMDAHITIDSGNIQINSVSATAAAIGGGTRGTGDVTINGGTITIGGSSQDNCVSIGSGYRGRGSGDGNGTITINGGTISVGSSIGINSTSNPDNIVINGGTVTASGGIRGSEITINDGEVNASGSDSTIGGSGSTVTINGGTVTAINEDSSYYSSPGIGGTGSTVVINGGSVTAKGGDYAAGIGTSGGSMDHSCKIVVNGGEVNATGGTLAAGIGAGAWEREGSEIDIEINGGTVTAIGGADSGAGIGGGYQTQDVTVKITGGTVKAEGGLGASGIGGGFFHFYDAPGSNISITGGSITATAGGTTHPDEHTVGDPIGLGGYRNGNPNPDAEVTMTDGVIIEQPYGWDANGHTHNFANPVHEGCKITETCAGNCGSIRITFGHNWDDGVVTKQPTTAEEGEVFYTCRECGATKTEVIPKLELASGEQTKAPLLTVTTLLYTAQPYEQTMEDGRAVFAAPAQDAVLTGSLGALAELKAQGAQVLVFRTWQCETSVSMDKLLDAGSEDDVFALTHKGTEAVLTVEGRVVK